jgi:hypothetical protein
MSATNIYSGPQVDGNGQACIHLQGIGLFAAKPANELAVGDKTVWNYGHTADVSGVRHKGNSTYVTLTTDDGKTWPERRFNNSRLVACTRLVDKVKYL